jgi:hypothetical protein
MSLPGGTPASADAVDMTRTYVLVLVCHAIVITTLWWFGHVFSS